MKCDRDYKGGQVNRPPPVAKHSRRVAPTPPPEPPPIPNDITGTLAARPRLVIVGQSDCFGCRPPVSPNPLGQIVRENSKGFADRGDSADRGSATRYMHILFADRGPATKTV